MAAEEVGMDLHRRLEQGMVKASQSLLRTLNDIADEMYKLHSTPWAWGAKSENLFTRTGGGLKSIRDSIKMNPGANMIEGQISTGSLTVHETGATITPKTSKYLTIPLQAAMDSRGVALRSKARDWDNTFIARSKRGNLIIFRKNTGGTITPLYVLKTSVVIPPRLRLGQTFDKMVSRFEAQAMNDFEVALNGK